MGPVGGHRTQDKPYDLKTPLMKIDGHCPGGAIAFEAEADSTAVTICNCADCRKPGGPAFRANVAAAAESFVLLRGTPESFIQIAESSNKRRHALCSECGTPIYACAVEDPPSCTLRIGTGTRRAAFAPKRQIWRRSARAWVDGLAGIPASERG